jgi:hypothetical protein
MNRNYKREYIEDDTERISELTKIGVFSFIKSSGTSFIATSLAKYLADLRKNPVAFIDLKHDSGNESLLYHALGMDQRFASRKFISFYSEIKNRKYIRQLNNLDSGINWVLYTPLDRDLGVKLTTVEEARLLNNVYGDWIVCDLGSQYYQESMDEMDILIGVIDPKPSMLLSSKNYFRKLQLQELGGRHLCWIINKYNKGVNTNLLKRHLKIKNPIAIPLIQEEWFYISEYRCRIPFDQDEIKKQTRLPIEELVNHHILFT